MSRLKTSALTLALLLALVPSSSAQRRQRPARKDIQITWLGHAAFGKDRRVQFMKPGETRNF